MPAVAKRLTSLFSSSPANSPRVKPTESDDAVPPLAASHKKYLVDRGGSPCSFQLFDVFKALAGSSTQQDFGEVDSDEDEETPVPNVPLERVISGATVKPEEHNDVHHVQHWIDETAHQVEREREALGSRFAALSLSNLAPPFTSKHHSHKPRPELPKFEAEAEAEPSPELDEVDEVDEVDEGDEEDEGESSSPSASLSDSGLTSSTGITTPDKPERAHRAAFGDDDISDEEKLAAIIDEFGAIAGLMENAAGVSEPERILAESKGSLFKGIMLVGNLHLTTHRLLFHAFLPPESVLTTSAAASHQSDVIMSGPVTIHRPGPILKQNKRVWMELSSEMVTTYPSADDAGRVRPLRCVLLSSVRRTEPLDPQHPCDFCVTYEAPDGLRQSRFTVDTEQSAVQWRRAFEGTIFRHFRSRWTHSPGHDDWSLMRVCVPLDRVTIKGITDYHSFSTLVGLDIQLDGQPAPMQGTAPTPAAIAQGDWSANETNRRLSGLHRAGSTSSNRPTPPASPGLLPRDSTHWIDTTIPPRLARHAAQDHLYVPGFEPGADWRNLYSFNVAVLNQQKWFADALTAAVGASHQRSYKSGVQVAKMVMTVAGFDCLATDEEMERDASADSMDEEDEDTQGGVQDIRKAEKARLAAKMFGLRDEPIYLKRCYVQNVFVPARGHIILSSKFVCFWRRAAVGQDIKYRFPTSDIKGAVSAPSLRARFHGMALQIHGHKDLRFEFWNKQSRDEVIMRINALASPSTPLPIITTATPTATPDPSVRVASPDPISPATSVAPDTATGTHPADILAPPKDALLRQMPVSEEAIAYMPFIANKPWTGLTRLTPRTFTCLTIGSRGDVQPYIALGLRLMKDGHKVVIVTHPEFKHWIETYGIEHRPAGGDPTVLMKLSQEHKMLSPGFFKESLGSFRQWLDDLLVDSWHACMDADVLIESASCFCGPHIAEKLKIPFFRAFTMAWTRTTAYPQAFLNPAIDMGPTFNYSTYVLYDNIIWQATSGQINRWRKHHLGLPPTNMTELALTKVPFLYNFSSSVVPKPLDWHDDISITGYWFLDDSDTDWTPPPELKQFIAKAKEDKKPLVYIGFGSIVVPRPNAMTKSIIKAVEKADVRAIIAKGWSSRGGDPATEGENIVLPPSCYGLEKVAHGWLFPQINAALHHGGAGTTGASLRAGLPTLIKPWFGDQMFWASRVSKLGVGLRVPSLRSDDIAKALTKATTDTTMIEKAARIGERIRSENGVDNALQAIHYNITRAASDRKTMKWQK